MWWNRLDRSNVLSVGLGLPIQQRLLLSVFAPTRCCNSELCDHNRTKCYHSRPKCLRDSLGPMWRDRLDGRALLSRRLALCLWQRMVLAVYISIEWYVTLHRRFHEQPLTYKQRAPCLLNLQARLLQPRPLSPPLLAQPRQLCLSLVLLQPPLLVLWPLHQALHRVPARRPRLQQGANCNTAESILLDSNLELTILVAFTQTHPM